MNIIITNNVMNRYKLEVTQDLLSDICKAVTGKIPATAALPKKVD
jgi:hypothetical protein